LILSPEQYWAPNEKLLIMQLPPIPCYLVPPISPGPRLSVWIFNNNIRFLQWEVVSTSPNPPSWRTTPFWLSAAAYSIYSQQPSILEAVPPSATWRLAMPCWQWPTYQGNKTYLEILIYSLCSILVTYVAY
jgi:hypothetical protein